MKNKGFTLIELLAVIVILAIIALIATPIILGIIEDSRTAAKKESAKLVLSSVKLAYSTASINSATPGTYPAGDKVVEMLERDLDNIVTPVEKTASSITVKTNDDVICNFSIDSNKKLKFDGCGSSDTDKTSYLAAETTEIGTLSAVPTESASN